METPEKGGKGERLEHSRGPQQRPGQKELSRGRARWGRPCSVADLLIGFQASHCPSLGLDFLICKNEAVVANQLHQLFPKLLNGNVLYTI